MNFPGLTLVSRPMVKLVF